MLRKAGKGNCVCVWALIVQRGHITIGCHEQAGKCRAAGESSPCHVALNRKGSAGHIVWMGAVETTHGSVGRCASEFRFQHLQLLVYSSSEYK
jgi:hypothetical protein